MRVYAIALFEQAKPAMFLDAGRITEQLYYCISEFGVNGEA